jgi:hypothetical protein
LRASTPDQITGTVELLAVLADDASAEPAALVELVSTWVRAVEIGFFGSGRIRLQAVKTPGHRVSGRLECEQVSQTAFHALLRMTQHFSKTKWQVESFSLSHEGQRLAVEGGEAIPALPQLIPFAVEFPNDLHADVRVEIEFRSPLDQEERDTFFRALSVWDTLVEALGDPQRWGEEREYETRLLSSAIVEHEVFGYFAPFECLHFIVLLGLRLHQRLIIERITME